MAYSEPTHSRGGIGFLGLLTIVFITLKLTGHIAWSWWWVFAPFWGPIALVLVVILIIIILAFVEEYLIK